LKVPIPQKIQRFANIHGCARIILTG